MKEFCKKRKTSGYYCENFEKSMETIMKDYLPKLGLTIISSYINMDSKKSKQLAGYKSGLEQDLNRLLSAGKDFDLPIDCKLFAEKRKEINTKLSQIEINMVMVLLEEEAEEKKRLKEMEQTLENLKNQKSKDTSNFTKFSVPIVTDYSISKLQGYTTGGGTISHYNSRFDMYQSDQQQPVIVQAVEKKRFENFAKNDSSREPIA
jgi:hypothetical protein